MPTDRYNAYIDFESITPNGGIIAIGRYNPAAAYRAPVSIIEITRTA